MSKSDDCVLGARFGRIGRFHTSLENERLRAREAVIKIISKSKLVDNPCLCGAANSDNLLASIDRWGLPISAVICRRCGLIRLNPRWEDTTYIDIYKNYYLPLSMGSFEITSERFQLSVERATEFVDFLKPRFDLSNLRVVEIGCSYGAGLYRLKETGASLVGYDYDERILKIGASFSGLDLRPGGLEAALKNNEKYDLVIFRHVFEHLLDPFSEAKSLKCLLKKNGKIFIEVPGVLDENKWTNDLIWFFDAFHTYYYSLKTLTNVMRLCGFIGEDCNNEKIYSIWSFGSAEEEVEWCDNEGVERSMKLLFEMEKRRKIEKIRTFFSDISRKTLDIFR